MSSENVRECLATVCSKNGMLSASCVLHSTPRDDHRMRKTQQGNAAVQIVWVLAGIVVIVAAFMVIRHTTSRSAVTFTTPYLAVVLTNGTAYFGKLEDYATPAPDL